MAFADSVPMVGVVHKGILRVWYAAAWTADVQLVGSNSAYLSLVPVNRGIASADMVVGRTVAVVFFSDHNLTEAMVLSVVG